jgi:hypothetical protein
MNTVGSFGAEEFSAGNISGARNSVTTPPAPTSYSAIHSDIAMLRSGS